MKAKGHKHGCHCFVCKRPKAAHKHSHVKKAQHHRRKKKGIGLFPRI